MKTISISDIAKKPSVLDNLDDIAKVVNKKTNEVKGIFISSKDLPLFEKLLTEMEYRKWLSNNKGLAHFPSQEDILEEVRDEMIEKIPE
ncbi:hypothetical protein [Hydrogenimonas cancrithermarum]|uniref:Antitoxin n=1 Tax=Hydrogenimonas cancrithermarum TaxID=2993563 RepID=A0ABM8FMR1_9BACT|nr:hypothetical protein [Hydrogenimonas cancrithermarum]BDY13679.1 hypothetical protein HCR_19910 [Hydrogenimonas cancrithermarum]